MLFQWVSIDLILVNYKMKDRFPVKNRQPHGLAAKYPAQATTHLAMSRVRSFIVGPIDQLHGGSKLLPHRGPLVKVEACKCDPRDICQSSRARDQ